MSSFYDLNQLSHGIAPLVEEDDRDHLHDPFATFPPHDQYPMFYNCTPQIQSTNNFNIDYHRENNIDHVMFHGSSTKTEYNRQNSNQWKSAKMRITRNTMDPKPKKSIKQEASIPDRKRRLKQELSSPSSATNDGIVRVCSDCKATKTPLWRSGPSGPKTLCNACGIRQRKARRAMAAAAAVSVGLIPTYVKKTASNNRTSCKKVADASDRMVPFKKRGRFSTANNNATASLAQKKKLCLDDIVVRLSKSSAFHRVFPQDEKDAAILLMAISCGLMCS